MRLRRSKASKLSFLALCPTLDCINFNIVLALSLLPKFNLVRLSARALWQCGNSLTCAWGHNGRHNRGIDNKGEQNNILRFWTIPNAYRSQKWVEYRWIKRRFTWKWPEGVWRERWIYWYNCNYENSSSDSIFKNMCMFLIQFDSSDPAPGKSLIFVLH